MTHIAAAPFDLNDAGYAGLRLSAAEYIALPDDGRRYELVDGVVLISASATPRHQLVASLVYRQLAAFIDARALGIVLFETDIVLSRSARGRELVYRPEIIFVRQERVAEIRGRITFAPDLVVEVVSPDSRSLDTRTKRADYAAARVREYWLIDPERRTFTFLSLKDGAYAPRASSDDAFDSAVLAGLRLDLTPIRDGFDQL